MVPMVDETDKSRLSLDGATDDYSTPDFAGPVIEVKWENYPEVKVENAHEITTTKTAYLTAFTPAAEHDVEYSVKVSVYAIHSFILYKHAVYAVIFMGISEELLS